MKTVQGPLRMLGSATSRGGDLIKYSVVQIGDKTLTDVSINRKLDNFLQAGLQTTADTKLWMVGGDSVLAVQVGAGQRYYSKMSPAFLVFAVITIAVIFGMYSVSPWVSLAFGLFAAWTQWRPIYQYLSRIPGEGGVKV